MKTKHPFFKNLKGAIITCAIFSSLLSNAQNYVAPSAFEDVFPTTPAGYKGPPTCYSFPNTPIGGQLSDLYISGWDRQVVWRRTDVANPTLILNQGLLTINGAINVNVGIIQNTNAGGAIQAIVSYYMTGANPGHYYDLYNWTPAGLTWFSTTQISNLASWTRISMDCHLLYACAITWQEPGAIMAVTGFSGNFSGPIALNGTSGYSNPDVAFSHAGPLKLQFVYVGPVTPNFFDIYEESCGFTALHVALGSFNPTNQDINSTFISPNQPVYPSIDCPDHDGTANWAYTYTFDNNDLFARVHDINTSLFPVTVNLINGSLGNAVMPTVNESWPRIAYNQNMSSFHVVWFSNHNSGGNGDCYFSVQVDRDATSLWSPLDYELVAFNSASPANAGPAGIALSKNNESSSYLYTVFNNDMGTHHAYHDWTNVLSFKSGNHSGVDLKTCRERCLMELQTKSTKLHENSTIQKQQMVISPVPFTRHFHLELDEKQFNNELTILVKDILGKTIYQFNGTIEAFNSDIIKVAHSFPIGTLFINVTNKSTGESKTVKTIHVKE